MPTEQQTDAAESVAQEIAEDCVRNIVNDIHSMVGVKDYWESLDKDAQARVIKAWEFSCRASIEGALRHSMIKLPVSDKTVIDVAESQDVTFRDVILFLVVVFGITMFAMWVFQ